MAISDIDSQFDEDDSAVLIVPIRLFCQLYFLGYWSTFYLEACTITLPLKICWLCHLPKYAKKYRNNILNGMVQGMHKCRCYPNVIG